MKTGVEVSVFKYWGKELRGQEREREHKQGRSREKEGDTESEAGSRL